MIFPSIGFIDDGLPVSGANKPLMYELNVTPLK